MQQKLRQILYELKHQPIISGITFIATALSILLFMIVFITQRVKTVPYPPESCRDRLLIGKYLEVEFPERGGSRSGNFGVTAGRVLYEGIDGVEKVTFFNPDIEKMDASGTTGKTFHTGVRTVDAKYFEIFDHPLMEGRYFTQEEAASGLTLAVVTESVARKAFGKKDCIGQSLLLSFQRYTVIGVIKDNSALANLGYGDVFLPGYAAVDDVTEDLFGQVSAALLVKKGIDFQHIRNQVKTRYAVLDTKIKSIGGKTKYHDGPYDIRTVNQAAIYSNQTPDLSGGQRSLYFLYAVLLLVPAINLSSLLHSRMRQRINEIGIRRAYGCTKTRIIIDILWENFIVTAAGGIVGIILGVTFALTYSGLYENMAGAGATPALAAVINWGTIFMAVGICFILNLMSASIPALQAASENPVEAINTK